MTTLKKTIIIEANREDSVEVGDYGTNTQLASDNKAEWTNILKNCNLKKGDVLSFDSACINSKGSNPEAIEFDGQNVGQNRNYTDNFAILQLGHYINHNLEYSVGLPFGDSEDGNGIGSLIDDEPLASADAGPNNFTTNPGYGFVNQIPTNANNQPYIFTGNLSNGEQDGFSSPVNLFTGNFFTRMTNNKYALINRKYQGAYREDMNPRTDYDCSMSTSEFKLKMEVGFQNPSNLSSRITAILHQTNTPDDFFNNDVVVGGIENSNYPKAEQQAFVNGKSLVNVACNGLFVSEDQNVFYQSIATDDPFRFEYGGNCLLQTTLVNLQNDINCNESPAFQSLENIKTIPGGTLPAAATSAVFVFEEADRHTEITASYKVGMKIVLVSGKNLFATDQDTIITAVAPGAAGQLGLQFTPGLAQELLATDAQVEIRAIGPGQYFTNAPIYLFANIPPGGTAEQYDNYSPHTDPESFELDGTIFLNGIAADKQPRSFGQWTFTRVPYKSLTPTDSIEYNHTINIELNDGGATTYGYRTIRPQVFLKWTGNDTAASENYLALVDELGEIYQLGFNYDDVDTPKSFVVEDSTYLNYNPNAPVADNEWSNASNGHNRTFTAQTLATNYQYDYMISSSDDPSINYGLNAQFGRTEVVHLFNGTTNDFLGTGIFERVQGVGSKITWLNDISVNPEEFITNNTFENYVAPSLPNWSFSPSNTDFSQVDLGNGTITRDSGVLSFIRQTGITGLQAGTTYEFIMRREDALAGSMYIRTQNGLNNVNVLWDNGATTNIRTITTNGQGIMTTAVSFEVLTAVDGIEIYFNSNGQSISECSLKQQGAGGGAVQETVWNLAVEEDVEGPNPQFYTFEIQPASPVPTQIDGSFADFRKSQIIPTNIEYTEDNLRLIEKFMRNTQKYIGTETVLDKIAVDYDNYRCRLDLGRTDDVPVDGGLEVQPENLAGHIITSNPVDTTPQIPAWLKNRNLTTDTIVNPRRFTPTGNREQRLSIFSYYKNDAIKRLNYKGTTGMNDVNLNSSSMDDGHLFFFNDPTNPENIYDDTLSQIIDVAVYPIYYKEILNANNPNGTLDVDFKIHKICVFELAEELTAPQADIFKIQWGINAIFSPAMSDCNQVFIVNPEMPLLPPYTADPEIPLENFNFDIYTNCNFVNIGAVNPTCNYNTTLSRFTFTEFHTPVQLNGRDAETGEGEVVIQFLNRPQGMRLPSGMIHTEIFPDMKLSTVLATNLIEGEPYIITNVGTDTPWTTMGAPEASVGTFFYYKDPTKNTPPDPAVPADATGTAGQGLNPGRNDSQAGIYLKDVFFQVEAGDKDIVDINDPNAVLMTAENYYNSLMYKMGFNYYTLKPIRFSDNPFNNRYNPYYQNRYNDNGRQFTLSPITTNSDFDIANATSMNIFPQYRKQKGQPKFKLGYNNNEAVNLIVNSYSITADDLPSQLNHGFYRVYVDFPMSSLDYIAGSQKVEAIGYILRNYQTGSFFFSYASSYDIPITQDTPLNHIRTSIRTADGRVARNLNPKCVVFYKIMREVPLLPTLEEQEQEIEELKTKNKKAYDDIMEQFNRQEEVREKEFNELQAEAFARGDVMVQVPIGGEYLGQQNFLPVQEPNAIQLLDIPQLLDPADIITLEQQAEPGVVQELAPGGVDFPIVEFDPPPLEPEAIQTILTPPQEIFQPGLIPSQDVDLSPERGTEAIRYAGDLDTLTDARAKLKRDITRVVLRNIISSYVSTDPTVEGLIQTIQNAAKEKANQLEELFDRIDQATTQKQYRELKAEIRKFARGFNYTEQGDIVEKARKYQVNTAQIPAKALKQLSDLFFRQGGGFGIELAQTFSNKFSRKKIADILEQASSGIRFNRREMGIRIREIEDLQKMSPTSRRKMKGEGEIFRTPTDEAREIGIRGKTEERKKRFIERRRSRSKTRFKSLNISEIGDKETRQKLNRTSPETVEKKKEV